MEDSSYYRFRLLSRDAAAFRIYTRVPGSSGCMDQSRCNRKTPAVLQSLCSIKKHVVCLSRVMIGVHKWTERSASSPVSEVL